MKKLLLQKPGLWIPAIFLALATISNYYKYISEDKFSLIDRGMYVCFVLFILTALLQAKHITVSLKNKYPLLFIVGLVVLNGTLVLLYNDDIYSKMLSATYAVFFFFLLIALSAIVIPKEQLNNILSKFYFIMFLFVISFYVRTFIGEIGPDEILNSNTRGFMLTPFLIYLLISIKRNKLKILSYIIGLILLKYSGANTSLYAFALLPLFMIIMYKVRRPRLIYTSIIGIGLAATVLFAYIDSQILTTALSHRNILWNDYLTDTFSSVKEVLIGTGSLGVAELTPPLGAGLNPHNNFVGIFHYNGIIALALYVSFIILSMKKTFRKFTVTDGILFLTIIFQFLESNVPLFTFLYPSLLFLINILSIEDDPVLEK